MTISNKELKLEAAPALIKLIEARGVLHTEKFVAMGIHDGKLFLLKNHARPERVVVSGGEFAFLNKKADGPAFNIGNNQTIDQAAWDYRFHGKDNNTFEDVLSVPQTEMECVLLVKAMKQGMETVTAGGKPNEAELFTSLFGDLTNHPDAVAFMMEKDPNLSKEEVEAALAMMRSVNMNDLNDLSADAFLAGAAEQPAVEPVMQQEAAQEQPQPQPQAQAQAEPQPQAKPEEAPRGHGLPNYLGAVVSQFPVFRQFGWV